MGTLLCVQGALAFTQVAAGTVVTVDTSAAVSMPGVVRVLTKGDIPPGASNEIGGLWMGYGIGAEEQVSDMTSQQTTPVVRQVKQRCAFTGCGSYNPPLSLPE